MTITKKADMSAKLKETAQALSQISAAIGALRDEWESVRTSAALTDTANATRDMLDAYALIAGAYEAEARRKAATR